MHARVFYVSNVSELNTSLMSVAAGDSVIIKNGIWQNTKIIFYGNGTADKPIYLMAETPGNVMVTGASNLKIAGSYLVVEGLYFKDGYSPSGAVVEFRSDAGQESKNCRMTNCAIVNFNPSNDSTDYKWVSLYGSYNRVDHCYFKGKNHLGTTLVVWRPNNQANYHLIDHNYFANRPYLYGWNGAETIRVGTSDYSQSDSFTTVEYNYFEECDGEIEAISNKSCGNIYRYNTFYKCAATLTLRHGNRCTVEGNYFIGAYKANTGGVRIIGEDHKVFNNYFYQLSGSEFRSPISIVNGIPNSPLSGYFQVKNSVVAFNTLIDNKYSITIGAGKSSQQSLPPLNNVIANNIVKAGSTIIKYEDTPINLTWQRNIMFGASLGITNPGGIKIADPLLVLSDGSVYRLAQGSPAIDSAQGSYTFVTDDIDGQPRGENKDAGCDQLSQSAATRKRIGPDDVGVTWMNIITNVSSGKTKSAPKSFGLNQNYPNPFNPETKISYYLTVSGIVNLCIYDLLGRKIDTLINAEQSYGQHETSYNASALPSGIYFCKLEYGKNVSIIKMILLK